MISDSVPSSELRITWKNCSECRSVIFQFAMLVCHRVADFWGEPPKTIDTSTPIRNRHKSTFHFFGGLRFIVHMNIMNPWADPTVGNSRCSLSLESLVLRHNEITSGPAGEVPSSGELLSAALGSLDF